jgi:hypothetical protein
MPALFRSVDGPWGIYLILCLIRVIYVFEIMLNDYEGSIDHVRRCKSTRTDKHGSILDYNGNPVLSAYAPLNIKGLNWAILAEIDVAEAFCPVNESGSEFFANYVEMYGYYDLFLINPDGYCFYTAAKESDYQTNLVSGKYSSSGLGKLARKVLQSKQFGLADFEPYAPSNGEPCAFIAQPVIHNGDADIVVALQLSLNANSPLTFPDRSMGGELTKIVKSANQINGRISKQ